MINLVVYISIEFYVVLLLSFCVLLCYWLNVIGVRGRVVICIIVVIGVGFFV